MLIEDNKFVVPSKDKYTTFCLKIMKGNNEINKLKIINNIDENNITKVNVVK